MGKLYPTQTIFVALGCLLQDPMLLKDSKVKLKREDFKDKDEPIFHLMIFAAINNLLENGAHKLTPADIDDYLSNYPSNYELFQENDGIEWCYKAMELAEVENYDYYAEKIKKFSLLRRMKKQGFSLEGIYNVSEDPDDIDEEERGVFDSLSVDDIIKEYEDRVAEIASQFRIGNNRHSSKAGDNGIELKNSFKEKPMYGLRTMGTMQNTILRGMMFKTSLLRSAMTNVGKTRIALAEATNIAISKWYNTKAKQWERIGKKHKVLFISTEMEEDELQPTMWSHIAGVAEEKIKDGELSEEEDKRIEEAILHLQECDLFIEYLPTFDPQAVNTVIKEYAIREGIEVVFFDYIHLSFETMIEMANRTQSRMSLREDMMLTIFAAGLEQLARDYNFHLRTSTQLNGDDVDSTTQVMNQKLLRGAKAMADKYQYGIIMAPPTEGELKLVQHIIEDNFGKTPNMVYHIYKNRKSKYKGKLFLYIDYDTMRTEELFFTNFRHEEIEVPLTYLEEEDDDDNDEDGTEDLF